MKITEKWIGHKVVLSDRRIGVITPQRNLGGVLALFQVRFPPYDEVLWVTSNGRAAFERDLNVLRLATALDEVFPGEAEVFANRCKKKKAVQKNSRDYYVEVQFVGGPFAGMSRQVLRSLVDSGRINIEGAWYRFEVDWLRMCVVAWCEEK